MRESSIIVSDLCVWYVCSRSEYLWVKRVTGIRAPPVLLHLQPLALERFIMCS